MSGAAVLGLGGTLTDVIHAEQRRLVEDSGLPEMTQAMVSIAIVGVTESMRRGVRNIGDLRGLQVFLRAIIEMCEQIEQGLAEKAAP